MDEPKVNISVDHSEPAFFSDTITISHTKDKVILDFTQTTPRFDQVGGERHQSFVIKHKTIITDPVFAKDVLRVLKDNVDKYEKQFGEIKMPKREKVKKEPEVKSGSASYIG